VLEFDPGMTLPNQASIEFSQDLGHAERIFEVGETLCLKANALKINVFTEDMERSLTLGA
jgi:iron(III) transport system ATP-binding protein